MRAALLVAPLLLLAVVTPRATGTVPLRVCADPNNAVASGAVDVAAVWGPLAGYFAARQREPLRLAAVHPQSDAGLPQVFDIAMAVRRGDMARLERLERFIRERRGAIDSLLAGYRVPRVEASGAVRW
jgi:mxaJ protein